MGHINELLATGTWVEVGLVDIIGEDRGNGDELSRGGRCDSHENDQERADGTTASEECNCSVWQDETGRDIGLWHAEREGGESWVAFEGKSCETHGGSAEPWDGEPGDTSHNVAWECVHWGGRNGLVVVAVI